MRRLTRAFTLLELVAVLAIVAVAAVIAIPALQSTIAAAELRSAKQGLLDSLTQARGAAITTGTEVTACPSRDGHRCQAGGNWAQGWIVHRQGVVLAAHDALPGAIGARGNRDAARFAPSGLPLLGNQTIILCTRNGRGTGFAVVVSSSGRAYERLASHDEILHCARQSTEKR